MGQRNFRLKQGATFGKCAKQDILPTSLLVFFQVSSMVLAGTTLFWPMCLSSICRLAWAIQLVAQQNSKK